MRGQPVRHDRLRVCDRARGELQLVGLRCRERLLDRVRASCHAVIDRTERRDERLNDEEVGRGPPLALRVVDERRALGVTDIGVLRPERDRTGGRKAELQIWDLVPGTKLSMDLEFKGQLIDICDNEKVLDESTWAVKGEEKTPAEKKFGE